MIQIQVQAPVGADPSSIIPGTPWHLPERPPARIICPRRDGQAEGIAIGLARDLCRPTQDPCKGCDNLELYCRVKN